MDQWKKYVTFSTAKASDVNRIPLPHTQQGAVPVLLNIYFMIKQGMAAMGCNSFQYAMDWGSEPLWELPVTTAQRSIRTFDTLEVEYPSNPGTMLLGPSELDVNTINCTLKDTGTSPLSCSAWGAILQQNWGITIRSNMWCYQQTQRHVFKDNPLELSRDDMST